MAERPSANELALAAARLAVGILLVAGIAGLSRVPVGGASDRAELRVALRLPAVRIEACRTRSEAELQTLPVHMRQPRVCERHNLPYELTLAVAGVERLRQRLEPAGVHGDRPVIVDATVDLEPGRYDVALAVEPLMPADAPVDATAPSYRLARTLPFVAGRQVLVDLLAERGELRAITAPTD